MTTSARHAVSAGMTTSARLDGENEEHSMKSRLMKSRLMKSRLMTSGCVVRSFEGVSGFTAALGDLNSDRRVDVVSFTTCSFCSSTIYASLAVGP